MTKQEFETRVGMTVDSKEYDIINEMYMYSDVDKDEFCKLWVKMNHARVKAWKQTAEKLDKERKVREEALDILFRINAVGQWSKDAMATLTKREVSFLESIGIQLDDTYGYRSLSAVAYDIMQKYEGGHHPPT